MVSIIKAYVQRFESLRGNTKSHTTSNVETDKDQKKIMLLPFR